MEIQTNTIETQAIKFSIVESEREIARAYLYLIQNDLHQLQLSVNSEQ